MASIQNEGWYLALRFQGGDERMPEVNLRIENLRKQFTGREFMVSDERDWTGKKSAIVILQRIKPKVDTSGWGHKSDCATNNEPAMKAEACDCGSSRTGGRKREDFTVGKKAYDLKNQQRKALKAMADEFERENAFEAVVERVSGFFKRQAEGAIRQGKTVGSLHHVLNRHPAGVIFDGPPLRFERHSFQRRQFVLGKNGFEEVGKAPEVKPEGKIKVTAEFEVDNLADAKGVLRSMRKDADRMEKDGRDQVLSNGIGIVVANCGGGMGKVPDYRIKFKRG